MRKGQIAFAALGLFVWSLARPCSIGHIEHELDPEEQAVDSDAPAQVVAEVASIRRGHSARRLENNTVSIGSCDDIGYIQIEILRARDNRSPPEKLGYRVVIVDGALPEGFTVPPDARRAHRGTYLWLTWVDGRTDAQEAFDFTVRIVPVDLAGNEGEPSEPVRLQHPGTEVLTK